MIQFLLFFGRLCILLLAAACTPNTEPVPPKIVSINIIDRDGMSETISNPDRLQKYEEVDFTASQPYQKVLRVYERDENNTVKAHVTSYHPNGQLRQCLDICNGRAYGMYREMYPTGVLKVEANVIGGQPDINTAAEKSWLFEGISKAWDEEGHLIAEIPYSKGVLQGTALYYHPNGKLWKKIPFNQNELMGTMEVYTEDGALLQTIHYVVSQKDGPSLRFWGLDKLASQETYADGKLITGFYYNSNGQLISSIDDGQGFRALFGKDGVAELQEFRNGILQGEIKIFNRNNRLMRLYHVQKGVKHGDEIEYYDFLIAGKPQSKLLIPWFEGKIQGTAKTWYENSVQESQREMSNNAKNGLSMAWYKDGNLMLIEEYDNNKLVRGEYFKKGEKMAVSLIAAGQGVATIFDSEGHFTRRISYHNGSPNE